MRKILILPIFIALGNAFLFAQHSFDTTSLIYDLKVLSDDSMEGRKTGTPGSEKAKDYIINRLKGASIDPFVEHYTQTFSITQSTGTVQAKNILSVIAGKKKGTIVISAHYDHLGINNSLIYNGADDNASGVAAILNIAQYFKSEAPDHRLIFAFFDAEERGLKGSAHFVNSLDLQNENIILNINLDMVSRSDKNELYACGSFHYPHLKEKIISVKPPNGIKISLGHDDPALKRDDWTSQSDQYNFHLKKIPFLYFGVEDHTDYHQPGDDFEKVNTVFYANSVEIILQVIKALDKGLE